jgi:hypothetical protein
MASQPKVSFVACSRNDDHGKDMAKRQKVFVRCLLDQCRKHKLPAELIIVEWNPPKENEPLEAILPKPDSEDFLEIRYITVPSNLHSRYQLGDRIPLFQMIGKNVGIRRAKGDFVVCTNVDLIFSDELMKELKSDLDAGCFYRANRCDIPDKICEDWDGDKLLGFA